MDGIVFNWVRCKWCGWNYRLDEGHPCYDGENMTLNGGDSLARGARSASFSTGGASKSQLQWDFSVLTEKEFLAKYPDITKARYVELFDEWYRGNA